MKILSYCSLLIGSLLTRTAVGQASPPPADTAGYVKGGYGKFTDTFRLGELTKTDGTKLTAYLPSTRMGYERILDYFATPPGQQIRAPRQTLPMQDVRAMRVHGRYYENLWLKGQPTKILALRILDGGVEVFTYAQPKMLPIPVPVAGALLVNAYTANHWYLRRNGTITEVQRGKFAEQLSRYMADYPALAQRVSSGETNYGYRDALSILSEYNTYLASVKK